MAKLGAAALALAAVANMSAPLARADKGQGDDTGATPAQNRQAGELVKKAIAKSQQSDHDGAIELYMQAYDLVPSPALLSNIGTEYDKLGKRTDAVKYFCRYLAADPGGAAAQYATTKVVAIQKDLGNDVDEDDVCTVRKKPPKPPATRPAHPVGDDDDDDDTKPHAGSAATGGGAAKPPKDTGGDAHPGLGYELGGGGVAVLGAVGIAIGGYYASKASKLSDAVDNHVHGQPWPSTIDGVPLAEVDHQGNAWNRDTYIFVVGGGILIAAGVLLFAVGHGQTGGAPAGDRVSVAPAILPGGGGGLVAAGRF